MRFQPLLTLTALAATIHPTPTLSAQADSLAVLTGTVVDSTGEGINFARVVLIGTPFGVAADSVGHFSFRGLPPGSYVMQARYVGYRKNSTPEFVLKAGRQYSRDITLFSTRRLVTTRPVPGEPAAAPELQLRTQLANRAEQLGWPVLRTSKPASTTRELRLGTIGGLVYQPWRVFRLVVTADTAYGELTEVWQHSPEPDGPYQVLSRKKRFCKEVDSVTTTCRYPTLSIDWRDIADSVAGLGAWESFNDVGVQHENVRLTDQDYLWAEAWIDGHYRSVAYHGPQAFTDGQTKAILAAARLFDRLSARVQATVVLR